MMSSLLQQMRRLQQQAAQRQNRKQKSPYPSNETARGILHSIESPMKVVSEPGC
jgi:hypothetical protein